MHDLALATHVVAGAVGLVAGPVAGLARKARGVHTLVGWVYQLCVAVLCCTSFLLVLLDPSLWPFALLAAATWTAAAAGVVVRRRRRPGWMPLHVQLVLGSYVSLVTAFSVQTVGGLAGWLVPTAVGSTVVGVVTTRVARQAPGGPASLGSRGRPALVGVQSSTTGQASAGRASGRR